MNVRIRHAGLVVRNLDISVAFYTTVFGLNVASRATEQGQFIERLVGLNGVVVEWAKLSGGNEVLLELLQYHSHPDTGTPRIYPANAHGCSHVAFTVDDIDTLHTRLVEAGMQCIHPPQMNPAGTVKVMYCHDPDGIPLEVVQEL